MLAQRLQLCGGNTATHSSITHPHLEFGHKASELLMPVVECGRRRDDQEWTPDVVSLCIAAKNQINPSLSPAANNRSQLPSLSQCLKLSGKPAPRVEHLSRAIPAETAASAEEACVRNVSIKRRMGWMGVVRIQASLSPLQGGPTGQCSGPSFPAPFHRPRSH